MINSPLRLPRPRVSVLGSTALFLIVSGITILIIFSAMFRPAMFDGVVNPGDAFDPGWHMFQRIWTWVLSVGFLVAFCHQARQDVWRAYGFFPPNQRLRWRFKGFDTAQTLEIGPFTGLENKPLVLVLRWKAQRPDLLKARAFTLVIGTPPEPFAKFNLQFFGQNGSDRTLLGQQTIQQKFNRNLHGRCGEKVIGDEQVVFQTEQEFSQYFVTVQMDVDYLEQIPCLKAGEKIFVEAYLGLRMKDLKHWRLLEGGDITKASARVV